MDTELEEWIALAVAGGNSEADVRALIEVRTELKDPAFWIAQAGKKTAFNAAGIIHRRMKFLPQKKFTTEEIAQAATAYRAGKVVPDDLIVEAVKFGFLSNSEAMNRDW